MHQFVNIFVTRTHRFFNYIPICVNFTYRIMYICIFKCLVIVVDVRETIVILFISIFFFFCLRSNSCFVNIPLLIFFYWDIVLHVVAVDLTHGHLLLTSTNNNCTTSNSIPPQLLVQCHI